MRALHRRRALVRRSGLDPAADRQRSILVAHPSADLYGSDRVLLESVDGMVADGWQVVVTLPSPGPLVAELTSRGARVELCPAPVLRKSALRPREFGRFVLELAACVIPECRLILRSGADAVYVNTITIPTWLVLGRLLRRRVVCHVHEAEGSAAKPIRLLISLPLLFAQQLIVNSHFSLDVLISALPLLGRRATVVYNGVPGPETSSPARRELTDPVRILFLGRLSPRKGPQVAIAALQQLHARGVRARLDLLGAVFGGYEWFEAELREAVAAAGLDAFVHFVGFDPDVWPHIAAADLVVVPSVVDEPFGNTAVEAVLGARPLVASATSGLTEAAAGYASAQLVPPDRPDRLADAVARVIADWDAFRTAAQTDARLARERHSVLRYQHEVAQVLIDQG
jgi:glycosyltransferase involved in cell wall biosynthesis